jgi:hypothetical protein
MFILTEVNPDVRKPDKRFMSEVKLKLLSDF